MVFSALIRVDAFVLNAAERLCRAWQILTGKTNVWLAIQLTNVSIVVYFVWAGVEIWTREWPARLGLGLFFALVLYTLTKTVLRVPIEASEASAYRRVMNGYRNPRRAREVFLRVPFLSLTVLLLYPSVLLYTKLGIRPFSYSLVLLTTTILYLLACDPLPPRGSKAWEWWRRLVASMLGPSDAREHARLPIGGPGPRRSDVGSHERRPSRLSQERSERLQRDSRGYGICGYEAHTPALADAIFLSRRALPQELRHNPGARLDQHPCATHSVAAAASRGSIW